VPLKGSFQVAATSMVTVLPLLASLKVTLTGSAGQTGTQGGLSQ
jgi:hypothetical protein